MPLSSQCLVNRQPSCRSSEQGHDDLCRSTESASTAAQQPGDFLVNHEPDRNTEVAVSSSTIALPRSTSQAPQSCSTPDQQSRGRRSTIPAEENTLYTSSSSEEPFPSPTSSYSLDFLWRKQATMSLTGDGNSTHLHTSPRRPGARYVKRMRVPDRPLDAPPAAADDTPTKLRASPNMVASSPTPNPSRSKITSPAVAPRFSLFSMATLKGFASPSVSVPRDDELISLDIDAALFPAGPPTEGDLTSSAAFKKLTMNATTLLRKFQAAYQDKAIACQELRAERYAQEDEKMEAETRTAHLKMQLEGMAQRAAENEAMMRALMEQLNREKRLRLKEKAARGNVVVPSCMSSVSEDLGVESDQSSKIRRDSGSTTRSEGGTSDTDTESVDEFSVFSRSRSPTVGTSSCASSPTEGFMPHTASNLRSSPFQVGGLAVSEPPQPDRQPQPQMSAFQKILKGISGETADASLMQECQNCRGQDASVAWDTASLLRDENRGLKQRVGDLESAVEEALDAVLGVRL